MTNVPDAPWTDHPVWLALLIVFGAISVISGCVIMWRARDTKNAGWWPGLMWFDYWRLAPERGWWRPLPLVGFVSMLGAIVAWLALIILTEG